MRTHRIKCEDENLVLAARAVKYGIEKMPNRTAIVIYGDRPHTVDFFVKRTKHGVSVTQCYSEAITTNQPTG